MFSAIKTLLSRYRVLRPPNETVRSVVASVISKNLGFPIETKDIHITKGTAYIEGENTFRAALALKRDVVMRELNDRLGKNAPKDVR